MNNIAGFIQPSMFQQPSVMGIMPSPVPIVTAGGKSDILTIAVVAVVVVVVLFVLYRNVQFNIGTEESEEFKQERVNQEKIKQENFEDIDPLTKCGWEVIVSPTCPWCIKQKEVLSKHFPLFKNIFTDKPAEAVPMWVNNKTGDTIPGFQTYEKLLNMIKC